MALLVSQFGGGGGRNSWVDNVFLMAFNFCVNVVCDVFI